LKQLIYLKRSFLTANLPELSSFPKAINNYESLHKFSIENKDVFWGTLAKSRLEWYEDFKKVTEGNFSDENFHLKWFLGGKLNVSVNCVDRHYLKNANKVALIWEKDEAGQHETTTYEELYKLMNQMANVLKSYNIKKGDIVAIYMPCCSMTVAAMLACARIGAIHSVIFAGFSADALASRINDSECKAVITANQGLRGGKAIELKKTVDKAVEQCPSVEHVFVYKRTDTPFKAGPKDVILDDVLNKFPSECKPEIMDSEDPLFMLYTSGSTGKPKGLIHSTAGYLLQTAFSHQIVFNYDGEKNDVFGCLADVGWITGHSYVVYGPLCNGGTTVLFESTPIYPDPGRYWETVERLKINQLYLAPTAIRLLMKYDDDWTRKYDKSSLKLLGSVGEPINHEAWHWYNNLIGQKRCKIADTWWQTETGSACITPLPCNKNDEIKPAMAMRPFLGIETCLVDEKGKVLEDKSSNGILCIKSPWPSMARTIFGDHQRYLETYLRPFPGFYFTGDGALTDKDGHIQITGRVDDVINVSGHRIGTAELEDILDEHHLVTESAVVGFAHDLLGEGIYAFLTIKEKVNESDAEIIEDLKRIIKKKISGYAVPHYFLITPNLPRTRSGKIMRRVLRKIAENKPDEFGDLSTLAEPAVVNAILQKHLKLNKKK
jgi:acetyl-CoA synthetase